MVSTRLRGEVAVIGYGETPVTRARTERGEPKLTAEEYYAWAAELALEDAGLAKSDLDGQGLGVAGSEWPHAEIWSAEVAQNLGISPKILIRADHGGMNAGALLVQAALAIHSGIVDLFLCVGADAPMSMDRPGARSWRYDLDYGLPFGMMGPNSMVAFILRRHMHQYGTKPEQLGKIAVTERHHATLNPNAYLKTPITIDDYLNSRMIADPVRLLDCCILVNGGLAFILASRRRARKITDKPVYLLGFGEYHNYYAGSRVSPDITTTGIVPASKEAFKMARVHRRRVSFVQPYDDYTIMALIQLEDMGFCEKGAGGSFLEETDLSVKGQLPINTGGGLLSAGQAGMAGGFLHVVEAVRQLRGEAGQRQVEGADIGVVSAMGGLAHAGNLTNNMVLILSSEA